MPRVLSKYAGLYSVCIDTLYVASYRSLIVNNEEREIKFCLLDSLLKAVRKFCPLGILTEFSLEEL